MNQDTPDKNIDQQLSEHDLIGSLEIVSEYAERHPRDPEEIERIIRKRLMSPFFITQAELDSCKPRQRPSPEEITKLCPFTSPVSIWWKLFIGDCNQDWGSGSAYSISHPDQKHVELKAHYLNYLSNDKSIKRG
jgi:hypothetical protein